MAPLDVGSAFLPEAPAIGGFARDECLAFDEPKSVMDAFREWIAASCTGRAMFVSDNNGFDWQLVNWYFHHLVGENPFGYSSTNLGSLYKGMRMSVFANFKHLCQTAHPPHPVDDARGNAEALLRMKEMGLEIDLA